jgi:hypothetical protein
MYGRRSTRPEDSGVTIATRLPKLLEEKWRLFGWRILVNPELRVLISYEHVVERLQSAFHRQGCAFGSQAIERKADTGSRSHQPIQGAQVVLLVGWQLLAG